jgi:hypothetical protein
MTDEKPLEKLTVKELRDMAREMEGIDGIHAMKKDELIAAIKKQRTPDHAPSMAIPKDKIARPAPLTIPDIKDKIKILREKRESSKEGKDKSTVGRLKRRISRLKKKTRKLARKVAS